MVQPAATIRADRRGDQVRGRRPPTGEPAHQGSRPAGRRQEERGHPDRRGVLRRGEAGGR